MSNFFKTLINNIPPHIIKFVEISDNISEQILNKLNQLNLTKYDLALYLGINEVKINSMLSGKYNFDLKTLTKIDQFFQDIENKK